MTQTKKSGGVNVQRDTMENIVMVRNSGGGGGTEGAVIHRLSVSVILQKRFFQFFSSSYLSDELIPRRSLACPFPQSVATNLSS